MAIIKVEKRVKGTDGLYNDIIYQKTSADLVVTTNGNVQTDLDGKAPLVHTHDVVSKTSPGLTPQLPNETATTKFLRQDGTWVVPPDTNTTYGVATTSVNGLMASADKTKLDGIATGANNYTLPTASASVLGGVKVGTGLSIASGVLSVTNAGTIAWNSVTGKPATFPSAPHTHMSVSGTQPTNGEDVWYKII